MRCVVMAQMVPTTADTGNPFSRLPPNAPTTATTLPGPANVLPGPGQHASGNGHHGRCVGACACWPFRSRCSPAGQCVGRSGGRFGFSRWPPVGCA